MEEDGGGWRRMEEDEGGWRRMEEDGGGWKRMKEDRGGWRRMEEEKIERISCRSNFGAQGRDTLQCEPTER